MVVDEFRNLTENAKEYSGYIKELHELKEHAPEIFGLPTGTRLDEMFYIVEWDEEKGQAKRRALGGIPYKSVINVVGIPDTGKSVFAEQFAVYQAGRGYRVLFVTVESPALFLYNSLKQKCLALGFDFDEVEKNIIVLDASGSFELRENIASVLKTMELAIDKKGTTVTIVDSITGFYEHKEIMARQVVRAVYNFLKEKGQTALLVSQKRSTQAETSAEAAGGLAVAHIVDGTIVMDKKLIETKFDVSLYGLELGSVLRTLRIDGCRLCAHDSDVWVVDIDEHGLLQIKGKLREMLKSGK